MNETKFLITVLDSSFMHKVQIAKSLLEANDIPCYVFNENMANIIGTAMSEGYKLKVNPNDEERAKELIDTLNESED